MNEKRDNPGSWVLTWGFLAIGIYLIGGAVASSGGWPDPSLWWSALAVLAVVTFTASVVGAYYAGKGRR